MKHLISKEHHPHLKKRALLELSGLVALIALCVNQREIIFTAVTALRDSDVFYLALLFSVYWLLLPLTAISYRLLSEKKIPMVSTMLANLAAAGPGRIIPGGLGHISIGAVHMQKCGIKLQQAVIIAVANNVIGVTVNLIFVVFAIALHPTLLESIGENISTQAVTAIAVGAVALVTLLQWLLHASRTRKTVRRVNKQWKYLFRHLISNPHRLFYVILVAASITIGHATMLVLAGKALSIYISPVDAIIALSVGVMLGGAVPTPGGLGAVEAGTISALVLLGLEPTQAASVALLFRTATYWQPLLPGVFAYLYLREKKIL